MNQEDVTPLETSEEQIITFQMPQNMQTPPDRSLTRGSATTMNGVRIQNESYGIFGEMIINRIDIHVPPGDDIYITSEPKNLAPLEFLTWYVNGQAPSLWIYDWGLTGNRFTYIASLADSNFIDNYTHVKGVPADKVRVVIFQNYYNEKANCNMLDLLDVNRKFNRLYTSAVKGKPAPPSNSPSGWSVLEYKRLNGTTKPWASVPFMLGTNNLFLKDQHNNWYKPAGTDTYAGEENSVYKRVFWKNDGSAYRGG